MRRISAVEEKSLIKATSIQIFFLKFKLSLVVIINCPNFCFQFIENYLISICFSKT